MTFNKPYYYYIIYLPAVTERPLLWTPGETFPSFVSFWVAVLGSTRGEDRRGGDLGFLAGGHQGTSSLLGPLKILLKCPIGTVIVASAPVCNTNNHSLLYVSVR